MTFSRPYRATLNGVSAASGKAGALIGALLFATSAARYGNGLVMIFCSFISIVSFVLTWFFVPSTFGEESELTDSALPRAEGKALLDHKQSHQSVPSLFDYFHESH